tara:strand:+ start:273 stop:905 length:633 start_codon:yes stop_codon:yes gene_type:complete
MSIEEQSRYFCYNLSAEFQATPTNNGTLKFYIPPLRSNGFSDHYKQALVKIKSVQIAGSTTNADGIIPIAWGNIGTTDIDYCLGGLNLLTNLGTGNSGFIGAKSQTIDDNDADGVANFRNRYGVLIKPQLDSVIEAGAQKVRPMAFTYEDFSDIDSCGILCGLPFGQFLDITFQEAKQGIDGNIQVPVNFKTGARIGGVGVSVTIEFKLI